ncbi:MAG: DUF456 domain-containing protein [Lutibacter sp.]
MDILLLLVGLLFILLGIIGSFLPVLPGPLTSWIGLLIIHLTTTIPINYKFLSITLGVAIFIWLIDYIIPAIGTKKFGGTRYGVFGTIIGLLIGIFFMGPFGIIIGPFIGAYLGELIGNKNSNKALKAAFGSFIGFLTSTFIKFIATIIFAGFYFSVFWEYRHAFFG